MTEKEYYKEKRVSSSSLKWFELSPLFYKKMLDKEIEQETKRYFELGKKIHMKLLEEAEFEKNYIYLDYEAPKSENGKKFCEDFASNQIKDKDEKLLICYKNNYSCDKLSDQKILEKANENATSYKKYIRYLQKRKEVKDVLSNSDNTLINNLYQSCKDHIAANKLLWTSDEDKMNGVEEYNEHIIFFDFLGVQCKSMIDRLVIDHKNKVFKLIDLKTTSNLGEFDHSFEEFKYYRQMAFYWIAILSEFKELRDYTKETYIIGLQKGDLPECKVFNIKENWLTIGLSEIEKLMQNIKWHQDNNLWEHSKEYYENNGIEKL
jgi:hypothetical protein